MDDIRFRGGALPRIAIIGATGFLGRELLPELLRREDAPVALLVRARNLERLRTRVRQLVEWSFSGEDVESVSRRLLALCADLACSDLGLTPDALSCLREVEEIYCLAATLSLGMPLEQARRANVETLRNLIRLAGSAGLQRLRCLHYVSTAYVAGRRGGVALEEPVAAGGTFHNNYEQSKAEAEALLIASGVPHRIYRPSVIVGSSSDGRASTFNGLYGPIRMVAAGKLPFVPCSPLRVLDVVPVDYVARSIATIAKVPLSGAPSIFHIVAGKERAPTVGEIMDTATQIARVHRSTWGDIEIPPLRYFEPPFLRRLLAAEERFAPNELRSAMLAILAYAPYVHDDVPIFDNARSASVLREPPPRFADYGERVIRWAIERRFDPRPNASASARPPRSPARADLPSMATGLAGLVEEAASRTPDAIAVVDAQRTWTYAELLAEVCHIRREIERQHGSGACLSIEMASTGAAVAQMLGALAARARVSLVPPCGQARPPSRPGGRHGAETPPPAAGTVRVFTSGTTGPPKLVEHDGSVVAEASRKVARVAMLAEGHRILVPLPLFHTYGALIVLPAALSAGATVVLEESRCGALPLLAAIARHRVTHLVGVSPVYQELVELVDQARSFELGSLEVCLSADDALLPVIQETFEEAYIRPLVQGYGLTEALAVAMIPGFDPRHGGSVGEALEDVSVAIRDERGNALATGTTGEIIVSGAGVMLGYVADDDLHGSRPSCRATEVATGDLGWLDQSGYLYVEGRKDLGFGVSEVAVLGSTRISCRAVEDRLIRAGHARRAKALATRERLDVFLVPPNARDPTAAVRNELRDLGVPMALHLLAELPSTPVGKIASGRLAASVRVDA